MLSDNFQQGLPDPSLQQGLLSDTLQQGLLDTDLPKGLLSDDLQPAGQQEACTAPPFLRNGR